MKRFIVAVAAVVLMAPAVLGLTSGTASAGQIFKNASISIHNPAYLVTMSTPPLPGVDVTVTYSCAPTSPTDTMGFIFVSVSQNPTYGDGEASATCDDKSHLATVFVAPFTGAFTPGAANASAQVFNDDDSAFAEQVAEITIK